MTVDTVNAVDAAAARRPSLRRRRSLRRRLPVWIGTTVALLLTLLTLLPVFYMLLMSVRTRADISAAPLRLPSSLHLENYVQAFAGMRYWQSLGNTLLITLLATILVVVLGSLAAYPLARLRGRLSASLYALFALGLIVPGFASLTPLYILMRDLHLLNTYAGAVVLYAVSNLPLAVFFYTSFLHSVPRELEEAAAIDGCTPLQAFRLVVFPLLAPVTGTLAMFVTLSVWNDLLTPLLFLSRDGQQTVMLSAFRFIGTYGVDPTKLFPACVLGVLPLLLLFFLLQRSIVSGIAAGAVKG